MEQKFIGSLKNAQSSLKLADHLTYMTLPVVRESRLLIKVLTELNIFCIYVINAVLQHEYYFKRIALYKDAKSNLNTFREECVKLYDLTSEVSVLFEIMRLSETHKKSPMEFVKNDTVVIMSDSQTKFRQETLDVKKIKEFIKVCKSVVYKVEKVILQNKLRW